ncbi:MAG: galactose mutarotase [Lachnospiraceae bacterium]|nr:galactose mutarotase [Lachnospiraceae bacterium]
MSMQYFGSCPAGEVHELTISNGRGLEAKVLSLGATLRSLLVTDESGRRRDVVLGYDSAEEYFFGEAYFGATVGRFCNRIAAPGFELDGKCFVLPPNEGKNQLHGGPFGFSRQIWTPLPAGEDRAVFRLISPDGDMGFPGNLMVQVTYRLTEESLVIEYEAETDAPTVLNLTNHSYFNLSGHESGSVGGHRLKLTADFFTPTDEQMIPTGEIRPVSGSVLDLRTEKTVGELISAPELKTTQGLDHNFVLSGSDAVPAAWLKAPDGTLSAEVYTDRPAIQVYTAGFLGNVPGKNGAVYADHQGICLETQGFPDAVHHPNFPSPVLRAGEVWRSRTEYRFRGASRVRRRKAVMIRI